MTSKRRRNGKRRIGTLRHRSNTLLQNKTKQTNKQTKPKTSERMGAGVGMWVNEGEEGGGRNGDDWEREVKAFNFWHKGVRESVFNSTLQKLTFFFFFCTGGDPLSHAFPPTNRRVLVLYLFIFVLVNSSPFSDLTRRLDGDSSPLHLPRVLNKQFHFLPLTSWGGKSCHGQTKD